MPDLSNRQTLTDLMVRRIKPRPSRFEVPDAIVPGLRIVVQPSGAKSWALRTRAGGKLVKITFPADSVADARDRARKALDRAGVGTVPTITLPSPVTAAPVVAFSTMTAAHSVGRRFLGAEFLAEDDPALLP